ncbi:beclin 1-associated autophagy-related key regulator [Octopus vulgaris]|uniref:Beclin 1-associated autophagy-related key regulator n=1 Tax=Octopus vulgaris TaxID=6645 RepID=A0AA36BS88_OCTVU|nr:beclin 1-associated autophagy-related key regulator [Octopus vulgaris]
MSCVNTGQFNYSNYVHQHKQSDQERYCDKLERWIDSKANRERYLQSIKPGLENKYTAEKKKWELENLKEKIRLLKLILAAEKESLQKDKEKLAEDKRLNRMRTERAKVHRDKKLRIVKLCDNIKNKIKEQNVILKKDVEKLVKERRSQANILVQYIFPISEIKPNSDSAMELSTESALKDACQTAYMKGFWVYGDKTGDNQYQIVSPTLPANGDFSIYHMAVEAKSEVIPDTEPSHCNPAHTISAALCYTTQLVSVLSYILDVTLPRRQSYIDFCRGDMSKKQFNSAVGRLNQNIVHLCQSQGVPSEEITPMLHLQNILLLLSSPRLGSESPFEAQADIIQSIEKISLSDDSEEDRDSIVDETDSNFDWERVCYEIPEVDRTGQVASYIPNIATSTPMEPQTTAGSIMSTAAASVASFWRAAASHFDRR